MGYKLTGPMPPAESNQLPARSSCERGFAATSSPRVTALGREGSRGGGRGRVSLSDGPENEADGRDAGAHARLGAQGNYIHTVCAAAGIDERTYFSLEGTGRDW